MPEIPVDAQIFDLVFHPTFSTVYTGLLTGHVEAFAYDQQGNHKNTFSLRPSKRSCRGLSINEDGSKLYAAGKSKALYVIDTRTEQIETRAGAHESPINRVKDLTSWLLTTGDDEGVIKLWDPRQKEVIRTYTHHFDYISDFLWLEDKRQLVATSADRTLSVMDVRSKKPKPFAQSEDQEDELLSLVAIKGDSKVVVGTQLGMLSVFNRNNGWGDCVDRIPGHPLSVDTLCNLPSDLPGIDTTSTILTGSSDGYVRAVQLLPTKMLGVVADHRDWPVERIAVGSGIGTLTLDPEEAGDDDEEWHGIGMREGRINVDDLNNSDDNCPAPGGRWWVGSVGQEDGLTLSDLVAFLYGSERPSSMDADTSSDVDNGLVCNKTHATGVNVNAEESFNDSRRSETVQFSTRRKRKQESHLERTKKNAVVVEDLSFFGDL